MGLLQFQDWVSQTHLLLVALVLIGSMAVAAVVGTIFGARHKSGDETEGQVGYVVSAVLGLLALLLGFTFSLAVDRFEARRGLVLQEANAIGTAYLRVQLLEEPHRARMTDIVRRYVDNRVAVAKATERSEQLRMLAINDALVTDLWTATSAAFPSIQGLDFSSAFLDSVNTVIDLDTSRKMARMARVPPAVFFVLFVYLVTTAGVLGFVLKGKGGRLAAGFLLLLLTLALALIIDIDRPAGGGVVESQAPMEALQASLHAQSPAVYDRWRTP
jgi:hypothetical protein